MSCGTLDTGLTSTTSVTGLLPCLVLLSNNLLLAVSMIPPVRTPKIRRSRVWALSRSLAATKKIDVSFSSSGYLDVSVHRVPSVRLWIHRTVTGSLPPGSPIQTPPDRWIFAPPRGFSQLIASFFGSQCQGIRPAPFFA